MLTFKNSANLNILIHRSRVVNILNKFEFSSYGKNVALSGGYLHGEFRYLLDRSFEIYPYAESQWQPAEAWRSSSLRTQSRTD